MAELSIANKQKVTTAVMRGFSQYYEETPGLTKSDIRAAVDALDTWLNDNQVTINNALPTAARTILNTGQKANVFTAVQVARYMVDNPAAIDVMIAILTSAKQQLES